MSRTIQVSAVMITLGARRSAIVWYEVIRRSLLDSISLSSACSGGRHAAAGSDGLNLVSRSIAMR